ncbi:MAG: hypothetical protein ABEJ86_00885 [Halococcoides sp.]
MPLFGPRLDAPTAVGDEGRPRATGLWVASLAVGAVAVAIALLADLGGLVGGVASMAGFVVAGMGLLDRDRFAVLAFGHLLFVPSALLLVTIVVASALLARPGAIVVLAGLATAILGLGAAWANVDRDHLAAVNRQAWIGAMIAMVALPIVLVGLAVLVVIGGVLVPAAIAPAQGPDLAGLAVVVGVTAGLVVVALQWLPIAALAPADRTARVATWVGRAQLLLGGVVALAVTLWIPLAIVGLVEAGPTLTPTLERLLASPVLRGPPVAIALALAVTGAIAAGLRAAVRWLTRGVGGARARQIAPLVGGSVLVLIGVILVGMVTVATRTGAITTPMVGAIQLLAIAVVTSVIAAFAAMVVLVPLAVAVAATYLDVLPPRAGSIAVATTGLLVVAVGIASVAPTWATIGVVVAALVVWDQGEFALGLTAELGHRPHTRGVELVHAGATLIVAILAVGAGTAIATLAGIVPIENVAVVSLAVLAALIASVSLRR